MEKQCRTCGKTLLLSDFYKHPMMADGYLNRCKPCVITRVAMHRLRNIDKIREYDRNRPNKEYRQRQHVAITRAWRAEDKRREKCHRAVANAIKSGRLDRSPCAWCGNPKSVAHHENYDKPLRVTWLCQPCHMAVHKFSQLPF